MWSGSIQSFTLMAVLLSSRDVAKNHKNPTEIRMKTGANPASNPASYSESQPTSEADPILTAEEVAKDLRCSKSQVYRLLSGRVEGLTVLPHLPLGRKKVVPRSVLEQWKRHNIFGMMRGDSEKITVDAMH